MTRYTAQNSLPGIVGCVDGYITAVILHNGATKATFIREIIYTLGLKGMTLWDGPLPTHVEAAL